MLDTSSNLHPILFRKSLKRHLLGAKRQKRDVVCGSIASCLFVLSCLPRSCTTSITISHHLLEHNCDVDDAGDATSWRWRTQFPQSLPRTVTSSASPTRISRRSFSLSRRRVFFLSDLSSQLASDASFRLAVSYRSVRATGDASGYASQRQSHLKLRGRGNVLLSSWSSGRRNRLQRNASGLCAYRAVFTTSRWKADVHYEQLERDENRSFTQRRPPPIYRPISLVHNYPILCHDHNVSLLLPEVAYILHLQWTMLSLLIPHPSPTRTCSPPCDPHIIHARAKSSRSLAF